MTRIFLGGHAEPTPDLGLPAADGTTFPPQGMYLPEGSFDKTEWEAIGYTNYEVWCVGAAAGRGGVGASVIKWKASHVSTPMPTAEWDESIAWRYFYLYQLGYSDAYIQAMHAIWKVPPAVPSPGMYPATIEEYYNYHNPSHLGLITTYLEPVLEASDGIAGGAGGGGGLHKASGLLADLDTLTDVVVGAPGVDGGVGQYQVEGDWTPKPTAIAELEAFIASGYNPGGSWSPSHPPPGSALARIWSTQWPDPHETISPPDEGTDGEASSFGDICLASGGKAGHQPKEWISSVLTADGAGGEGGVGNSDVAGGGAAGGVGPTEKGHTGTWDGAIGQGGGGGRGAGSPTDGGRGSFSSDDRSVYGIPGPKFWRSYTTYVSFDYVTGNILTTAESSGPELPGCGGGARLNRLRGFGSRADGYDPNGAVFIRITRVED